jgi:hypothetical protein
MLKFKYHYLENTLAYQTNEYQETWYQISEEQQFKGSFGSWGFKLEEGWITFTIYEKNIKAFYKYSPNSLDPSFWKVIYYRKYLAKDGPVIFEFSEKEEVEKVGGKWINKQGVSC